MLNTITVMGRLVKDPETRTTQSGVSVSNFTVAVDRDYKNGDEKVADYIPVCTWRGLADFCGKYLGKGRMVVVSGSLQSKKWQDKDGNNRTSWEVQAQNVYFADSKKDGGGQSAPASPDATYDDLGEDGSDLPF